MNPHLPSPRPTTPTVFTAVPAVPRVPDTELREILLGLQRVHGEKGRRALLLALLHTPGSAAEQRAWQEATASLAAAERVRIWALVDELPAAARLPVLEDVLRRCSAAPRTERNDLLRATRQLMCADGKVGPMDRLRWLLLRHRLVGVPPVPPPAPDSAHAQEALADLPQPQRLAIAHVTAYLARLVPEADVTAKVGSAGAAWYRAVLRLYWFDDAPACQVPDVDRLVHALGTVQALTWAQRPVLARLWVQAALKVNKRMHRDETLGMGAAEALRLASGLLDAPLHAAVAERFVELPASDLPDPLSDPSRPR